MHLHTEVHFVWNMAEGIEPPTFSSTILRIWSSVKITDSFSEKNPVVARQLCEVSQDAANNIVSHTQAEICSRSSYVSAWYCRTC